MRCWARRAIAAKSATFAIDRWRRCASVGLGGIAAACWCARLWASPSAGDCPRHRGAPALLLLDEPVAGLNVNEAAHVSELIARIRDAGTTVILVEHHMDVVMRVSDEITVLNYGRRLAHGTPTRFKKIPT